MSGTTCHYSSLANRGAHIVSQHFYYEKREEAVAVVDYFRERRALRKADPSGRGTSRRANHLLAIPGSKGSGKSSFLANFPESESVKQAFNDPIVSTLTFNFEMTNEFDRFGLRVLYGAVRGMLDTTMTFTQFTAHMGVDVTFPTAVEIIWDMFGYRSLLVCVDELSKSKKAQDICTEIGDTLDQYEHLHVLISSLSPEFVAKLASASNRDVCYVAPAPLFRSTLAAHSSLLFAQQFPEANKFQRYILQHIYLLASGHPYSLQLLDTYLLKPLLTNVKTRVRSLLKSNALDLIHYLCKTVATLVNVPDMAASDFELVLHSEAVMIDDKAGGSLLRIALEENKVFVGRFVRVLESAEEAGILPAMSFAKFLPSIRKVPTRFPLTRYAKTLMTSANQVADLLERVVDLTILSRSFAEQPMCDVFGVESLSGSTVKPLQLADDDGTPIQPSTWRQPPENEPGLDSYGLVAECFGNNTSMVYVQVKCFQPASSPVAIWASAVRLILDKHYGLLGEIETPYIIFYENFLHEPVTKEDLLAHMASERDIYFVKHSWDHICSLGPNQLSSWLLPTLVPLVRLLQEIEVPPVGGAYAAAVAEERKYLGHPCPTCGNVASSKPGVNCLPCFRKIRNAKTKPQ